jgi:hypothetical protein
MSKPLFKLRSSKNREKDVDEDAHIYRTPVVLDLRNDEQKAKFHSEINTRACNSCPALSPTSKSSGETLAIPPLTPLSPLTLDENKNATGTDEKETQQTSPGSNHGLGIEGEDGTPVRSRLDPKVLYDSEEFKRLKEKHEKQLYRESLLPPPRHRLHNLTPELKAKSSTPKVTTPKLSLPGEIAATDNPLPPTYSQQAYPNLRPPPTHAMQSYYDWDVITANIEVIKQSMTKWEQLEQDIEELLLKKSAHYNRQSPPPNPAPTRATSVTDILNQ